MAGVGVGLLVAIVLTRTLGEREFGRYVYLLSWVVVFASLFQAAVSAVVVRETAQLGARGDWSKLRGLIRVACGGLPIGLAVVGALVGSAWVWADPPGIALPRVVVFALALLPALLVAGASVRSVLEGGGWVARAQLSDNLVQPLSLVAIILVLLAIRDRVGANEAICAMAAATGVAVVLNMLLVRRWRPAGLIRVAVHYDWRRWLTAGASTAVIGALTVVIGRTDVIMLGALSSETEAGVYTVAARIAELVLFAKIVGNTIIAPHVAAAAEHRRFDQMQSWLNSGVLFAFAGASIAGAVLLVLGTWMLGWFGEGFVEGRLALLILVASHVINAACGSVAMVLLAVGREAAAAAGMIAATALNIALNYLLIPTWGMAGAACATAISLVVWNLALLFLVWLKVGVDPTMISGARCLLRRSR